MQGIVEALTELLDDNTVPKNIKMKVQSAILLLKTDGTDKLMSFSKAMHELEEACDDSNIQTFTRMQILNVVSMLELKQ